jgi:hypothetical protein
MPNLTKLYDISILCEPNKMEFDGKIFDHLQITDSNDKNIFPNGFYFRKLINVKKTNEIIGTFAIDNMFMAYSNSWVSNYQHLLSDFYPYLYYYKMTSFDSVYLGIPEVIKSSPIEDLIDLLDLKSKVVWLRNNVIHKVTNYYTYKYGRTLTMAELDWSLEPLKYLNNLLNARNPIPKSNSMMFISRDDVTNSTNNNNFAGKARDILNKDRLYDYFKSNKILVDFMSKYKIVEKASLLSKYDYFMTLYGANIINLVFAKTVSSLIVFGNTQNVGGLPYYKKLLESLFNRKINLISIVDSKARGYFNQPYIANVQTLHNTLMIANKSLTINNNHLINIVNDYKTNEEFLREYLFKKLLGREPNCKEFNFHLKSIKERGRESVLYEFTSCYEYHLKNASDYMSNLLKNKGTL